MRVCARMQVCVATREQGSGAATPAARGAVGNTSLRATPGRGPDATAPAARGGSRRKGLHMFGAQRGKEHMAGIDPLTAYGPQTDWAMSVHKFGNVLYVRPGSERMVA